MNENTKNRIYLSCIFVIICFFLLQLSVVGVDVHHQGMIFASSMRVIEDQALYIKNMYHYGPLPVFINAIVMTLTQKSLITIQYLTVVFYALSGCLLYSIWSRFTEDYLAFSFVIISFLVSPFLFWEMLPWSSVSSLFFSLLTLITIYKFLDTDKLKYLIYVGIFASLCFWSRQSVGILITLSVIFYLAILNPKLFLKNITPFCIGFLLTTLIGLYVFFLNDSYLSWYEIAFKGQISWAESILGGEQANIYKSVLHIIGVLFSPSPWHSIWGILPTMLIAYFLYILYQRFMRNNRSTDYDLAFIFISFASWAQYFPVAEPRHYFWSSLIFMSLPAILFTKIYIHKNIILKNKLLIVIPIFYSIFITNYIFCYSNEIKTRFLTGLQLDETLKLEPVFTRLNQFNYNFSSPMVLSGMKGKKDQVEIMADLSRKLELFDFSNGKNFRCYSGWDNMCLYYARGIKNNKNGINKNVILSDSAIAPENFYLFHKSIFTNPLAYMCGKAPCVYFLYVEK